MNQKLAVVAQLMKGRDPKEIVLQQVKNNNITDPTILQLIEFAESGKEEDLYKLAQGYLQRGGIDLNSEFTDFMKLLK